jgi:hypothetical protein
MATQDSDGRSGGMHASAHSATAGGTRTNGSSPVRSGAGDASRRSRRDSGQQSSGKRSDSSSSDTSSDKASSDGGRDWKSLAKRAGIFLVIGAVVTIFFATVLPRWWSHRMGDVINGSLWSGWMVGLAVGALFTALPLIVMLNIHRSDGLKKGGLKLLGALLLAFPNLLTLGIVVGNGSAAHAGQRTLDVEAPGFRLASLIGAIIGAALVAFFKYLMYSRKKLKTEADKRKAHNDALIAAHHSDSGDSGSGSNN